MSYFVHPQAICESSQIGDGTRVWAFAHVLPGARIGADCNICDHVFVENDVSIGNRVTIKCGVQVWDGVTLEDDVFIGPNVTFTNDGFPRSKHYPERFAVTRVCAGASIGANATILPGVTIGRSAMIGAGSVVVRSVPANAVVVGNPAKITGYAGHDARDRTRPVEFDLGGDRNPQIRLTEVAGVSLHRLPLVQDMRGDLSVGEFERSVPFQPRRYFLVFDVPSGEVRGEHAHRSCKQFLVCVRGSVSVIADDGRNRIEAVLDAPNLGILLPEMTWGVQYKYSRDAVLLVFASEYYDADEYIRDYAEYLALAAQRRPAQV